MDEGGGPGQNGNGKGLNGIYYDWSTGTYRSTYTGFGVGGATFYQSDFAASLYCGAASAFVSEYSKEIKNNTYNGLTATIQIFSERQWKKYWCAFAVTSSLYSFYNLPLPSIYGINLGQFILATAYYTKNNMDITKDQPVDYSKFINQFFTSNGIYLYEHISESGINGQLSLGRPIFARIDNGTGLTHALLIVGINTVGYIYSDPGVQEYNTFPFSSFHTYKVSIAAIEGVNPNF